MCARSKVVILGLLRKVRDLEAQIQDMELKMRQMKLMLVIEPKRSSDSCWKFWWLIAIFVAFIMYIGKI